MWGGEIKVKGQEQRKIPECLCCLHAGDVKRERSKMFIRSDGKGKETRKQLTGCMELRPGMNWVPRMRGMGGWKGPILGSGIESYQACMGLVLMCIMFCCGGIIMGS